jgi:hypothetical protein
LFRSFYVDGIARPNTDEGKYTDWITAAVLDLTASTPTGLSARRPARA